MNLMPKEKVISRSNLSIPTKQRSKLFQDFPFTIKFGLFMAFMVSFLLPLIIFSPLILAKVLGFPLAELIDMTANNFGVFVVISQTLGLMATLTLIAVRLKRRRLSWSSVGLRRFKITQSIRYIGGYYFVIFGLLIVLAVVAASLGIQPPSTPDGETGGSSMLQFMGGFWLAFALSVILAPVVEEVIFRGVLFPAITRRYGLMSGVIISSFIFTLVHIDPINMLSVLPLGIFLAIMYQRTCSIYPGMILHASWNFMVLVIAQSSL